MNPYVVSLLEDASAAPTMSRQGQGLLSTSASRRYQTVSSYGMSGTNACAVLHHWDPPQRSYQELLEDGLSVDVEGAVTQTNRRGRPRTVVHRDRPPAWPCTLSAAFSVASIRSSTIQFETELGSGGSYLSDHVVGGRPIMPGAGMFFMSITCASTAFTRPCLLLQASITTPMPLEDRKTLCVDVDVARGDVAVAARGHDSRARRVTSCRARIGQSSSDTDVYGPSRAHHWSKNTTNAHQSIQELDRPGRTSPTVSVGGPAGRLVRRLRTQGRNVAWWRMAGNDERAPTCISRLHRVREERVPAALDCSIHLGPATADLGSDGPRAVVAIDCIDISANQSEVHPVVNKRVDGALILTDHLGISHGDRGCQHTIADLQSKVIQPVGTSTSAAVSSAASQYIVRVQACDTTDARGKSDPGVAVHLFGTAGQVIALRLGDCRRRAAGAQSHPDSQRYITEFVGTVRECMGHRSSLVGLGVAGRATVAGRRAPCRSKPLADAALGSMRSFVKVMRSEMGHMRSETLTHDTGDVYSAPFGDEDVWAEAGSLRRPLLLRVDDKPAEATYSDRIGGGMGNFIVTGGTGALGSLIALWLGSSATASLGGVFLGRSGKLPGSRRLAPARTLSDAPAVLSFAMADSSKLDDIVSSMSGTSTERAIVLHAGGVLDSKLISNVTLASIRNIFSAKVVGSRILTSAMAALPVESYQLFSSLASFSGIRGQAVYAAANGALDGLGDGLYLGGIPVASVQWGNWGGQGMAAEDESFMKIMDQMGLGMIDPADGLAHIRTILATSSGVNRRLRHSTLMVNVFKWDSVSETLKGVPPILEEMIAPKKGRRREVSSTPGAPVLAVASRPGNRDVDVLGRLVHVTASMGLDIGPRDSLMSGGMDSLSLQRFTDAIATEFGTSLSIPDIFDFPDLHSIADFIGASLKALTPVPKDIESVVSRAVAEALGHELERDEPLLAAGLTSLAMTDLSSALSAQFDLDISQTTLIDYPTTSDIVGYIVSKIGASSLVEPEMIATAWPASGGPATRSVVSILSTTHAYPSDVSDSLLGVMSHTPSAYDNVRAVPLARWDKDDALGATRPYNMARFLDGIELFDPILFRMSPSEASGLDPQTRMLLESNLKLLLGMDDWKEGSRNSVGVYVGVMHQEYIQYLHREGVDVQPYITTGNGMDFMIGRLSFVFSLVGPCMSTHTACSSSLVSLHLGETAVSSEEASYALTSGVFTVLFSDTMYAIGQLGAFARDGRCKTFSAAADGYGRGEGVAAFALGRSNDGVAVLSGSCVRHAGKSSGLTAPNGPSQTSLIRTTVAKAGIAPSDIASTSCHGTGTVLGDPIEIGGISSVFSGGLNALISSKAAMGHGEGTAGLTGSLFALAAIKSAATMPTLYLGPVNPHIPRLLEENRAARFAISRQMGAHPAQIGRCTSTSSFGMSGVNAHAVFADLPSPMSEMDGLQLRRDRCWLVANHQKLIPRAKVLGVGRVEFRVSTLRVPALCDHAVGGRTIMPGTGMLDISFATADLLGSLTDMYVDVCLTTALIIGEPASDVECQVDLGIGAARISCAGLERATADISRAASSSPPSARAPTLPSSSFIPSWATRSMFASPTVNEDAGTPAPGVATSFVVDSATLSGASRDPASFTVDPFRADASMHSAILLQGRDKGIGVPVRFAHSTRASSRSPARPGQKLGVITQLLDSRLAVWMGGSLNLPDIELKALGAKPEVERAQAVGGLVYDVLAEASDAADAANVADVSSPSRRPWLNDFKQNTYESLTTTLQCLQQGAWDDAEAGIVLATGAMRHSPAGIDRERMRKGIQRRPDSNGASLSVGAVHAMIKAAVAERAVGDSRITLIDAATSTALKTVGMQICDNISAKQFGRLAQGMSVTDFRLARTPANSVPSDHYLSTTNDGTGQLRYTQSAPNSPSGYKIRVQSTSLNFRDVMIALGLYPKKDQPLASDCAGVIVAAPGGGRFRVGDRVLGIVPGCLGKQINVHYPEMLVEAPPNLSLEEAAGLPTVYSTALLCLQEARQGDRLLVHAGSGGLGIAIMGIATALGCVVHSTASTPTKRSILRHMGAAAVSDSRSTAFVQDIWQVDTVINSLTSPGMISASLAMLSVAGGMIEVGKRDIWSHARVIQERPDVHHKTVALDYMSPRAIGCLLERVALMLGRGQVKPPVSVCFALADVKNALRLYASVSQVGKIVVSPDHLNVVSECWMITGGVGALGQVAARHLHSQGATCTLLLGRTSRDLSRSISSVAAMSINVICDTASRQDWDAVRDALHGREIAGVVHSAGVARDATLAHQTPALVRSTLAPKLSLTNLPRELPVRHQFVYSSVASLIGSAGQSNYAAANGAVDAFVSGLNSSGTNAVSIQWGAWSVGMAANDAVRKASAKSGMMFLEPRDAMDALEEVVLRRPAGTRTIGDDIGNGIVSIMSVNWDTVLRGVESVPYMLRDLGTRGRSGRQVSGGPYPAEDASGIVTASSLCSSWTLEQIVDRISGICSSISGSEIGLDDPLMEHGIDSLGTVELQNAVNLAFGTSVDATTIFNFPSVRALSEHVASTILVENVDVGRADRTTSISPRGDLPDPSAFLPRSVVAVTGIVQQQIMLPSRRSETGPTEKARWHDCVVPTPSTRWDVDRFSDSVDADQVRFGVYLRDVFDFDTSLFRISVAEACSMDPQHRAILEAAWPLQYRSRLPTRTCVMTGIGTSDYIQHITSVPPDGYFASGCAGSVSSGRLSYLFNLSGPSAAVDTACSSSSVALHLAFREVKSGVCDCGIASGVNAILSPRKTLMFSLSGMLSSDGRCKTLDASANGYVRSESCTAVLIQPSDKSMAKDIIGYIAGTAVNQDGRSASLTAPNGPAQERAIAGALADAGAMPDTFAVSMHGTGTELGDPIEVGAVIKLFRNARVSLVATKGALGHAETGAGLVGVAGLLERQGDLSLPPMAHVRALNSHVTSLTSQTSTSIVIPRTWAPGDLHHNDIGGTSAFAFQGTNAHVVTNGASLSSNVNTSLVWKKKPYCVMPIHDRCLRLTAASGATMQMSHRASRSRLPPIPHLACIIIAHQTVEVASKDTRASAGGLALAVKGPATPGVRDVQEAVVTLHGDGYINIGFDGLAAFNCSLERIVDLDARKESQTRLARRVPAWTTVANAAHVPDVDFVATRARRDLVVVFDEEDTSMDLMYSLHASCELWATADASNGGGGWAHHAGHHAPWTMNVDGCVLVDADASNAIYTTLCCVKDGSDCFDQEPRRPMELRCGALHARITRVLPSARASNFFELSPHRFRLPSSEHGDRCVLFVHRAGEGVGLPLTAVPTAAACHVQWAGKLPTDAVGDGDIVISSLDQLLATCASSSATHALAVVGHQPSVPYCSPYQSSASAFYEAFESSGIDIKRGIMVHSSSDGLIGPDAMAIEALHEGVSMAGMMEHDRRRHIPTIRLHDPQVPAKTLFSVIDMDTEFSVDVWRDRVAAGRLVAVEEDVVPSRRLGKGGAADSSADEPTTLFHHLRLPESPLIPAFEHCVIVSGGTRGLGRVIAAAMARPRASLVLTSASGEADEAFLAALRRRAKSVIVKRCDWSEETSVTELLSWARENLPVVSLIVHAAGRMLPCNIVDMTESQFDDVVGCKVVSLKASVTFPAMRQWIISSISAIWSQTGGAHYTAASLYQQRVADTYHAKGVNITSGAFGPFKDTGMAAHYSDDMRALGLVALAPEETVPSFAVAASRGCSSFVYADILPQTLIDVNSMKGRMAVFDVIAGLIDGCPPSPAGDTRLSGPVRGGMDIHHRDESKRGPEKCCRLSESDIRARVVKALDEHLGIPVAGDAASENIDLVNVDSLTAVELSTSLSQAFDHPLPAALLFDYPSIPSLVEHLVRTLGANDLQTAAQQLSTLKAPVEEAARGTIVAMLHTRIPHANAEDAVSTTPLQRWRPAYADSLPVPFGAWLSDVDMFDSMAFGISPNEAIVMDPQHRALLEMVSESTAGTPVGRDGDRHIGVYVGIQHAEYISLYNAYVGEINAFAATSSAFSVAAGRISYIFGLQGPAMSLDTACSSAFSALHVAREDLVNCRTRRTICCAVNMMLSEKTTRSTTTSGMLSREGRCKALDAAADGYVRGEAVACLVMEIEGIHEYGEGALARRIVIDASNVNQDGRTSTLTAPNGPSQQRVIAGAMATALLDPREVCSLHMHGTGTSLGDPIEFGSLVSIFKGTLAGKSLSASKSIRGHAEPASGLVGMASASAQLHHAKLAPMQHLRQMNGFIVSDMRGANGDLPLAPRLCAPAVAAGSHGISAFAFQGTNAHIIVSRWAGDQLGSVALNPQMWRMARMWFGVRPNHMLTACKRADASTGPVVFSCQPATRKTLHDHVVSGKIILPATAMLEIFAAAGGALSLQGAPEGGDDRCPAVARAVIQRAVILGRNGRFDTALDVSVVLGSIVLQEAGGALVAEASCSMVGRAERAARKLPMRERLYQQFIDAAGKAFGTLCQYTDGASFQEEQVPVSFLDRDGVSEDGCHMVPELADAATHVQAAGQSQGQSTLYLPSTIDFAVIYSTNNEPSWAKAPADSRVVEAGELCAVGRVALSERRLESTVWIASRACISGLSSTRVEHSGELRSHPEIGAANPAIPPSRPINASAADLMETEIRTRAIVRDVLGIDVPSNMPLFEAGVDSLTSLDIIEQLNAAFGVSLQSTAMYDAPTTEALAELILETLPVVSAEIEELQVKIRSPSPAGLQLDPGPADCDVAIVDVCYRYPGAPCEDVRDGNPFVVANEGCHEIPFQRWHNDRCYAPREHCRSGMSYARLGKFLGRVDLFDAAIFSIGDNEALAMDPQQRLLLEDVASVKARQSSLGVESGVFVGCMYREYLELQHAHGHGITASLITGNGLSYLPARIAYQFNMQGPSVSTDTACSSSLVSMHQATGAIRGDGLRNGIVAGVNLMLMGTTTMSICQMSALSESGRCKTFDASADGYGRGEAVVSLFLADGRAGGAEALAVVASTGINQDGRSNGITAPNGKSQTSLIVSSLERAGCGPDYGLHSSHGTGTELGDPIEVSALRRALNGRASDFHLSIASSKSIVGHTEGAAGLTGLLQCLEVGRLRADCVVANLRSPNQYVISSIGDAFARIQRAEAPMGRLGASSVFGTSSFGMGGTNAYASVRPSIGTGMATRSSDHAESTFGRVTFQRSFWPLPFLNINILCRDGISKEWSVILLRPGASMLLDHRVGGRVLVPGAFWLDTAVSCQRMGVAQERKTFAVTNATFKAPHVMSDRDVTSATFSIKLDVTTGVATAGSPHGHGASIFESTNALLLEVSAGGRRSDPPSGGGRGAASLLPRPGTEGTRGTGIASVTRQPLRIRDAHNIEPARLDAYLHLPAAASSLPSGAERKASLPVLIRSFAIDTTGTNLDDNVTCMTGYLGAGRSESSSSASSGPVATTIAGLVSVESSLNKEAPSSVVFRKTIDPTKTAPPMYEVAYMAEEPLPQSPTSIGSIVRGSQGAVRIRSGRVDFAFGTDAPSPADQCITAVEIAVHSTSGDSPAMSVLTKGAFDPVVLGKPATDAGQRSIWGAIRSVHSELGKRVRILGDDIDRQSIAADPSPPRQGAPLGGTEHGGTKYRASIVPTSARPATREATSTPFKPSLTNIVYGGTTGIGLLVLKWSASQGARVLATGRSGHCPGEAVPDGTIVKSDLAFQSDTSNVLGHHRLFEYAWHSGGLNDDRLAVDQRPGSIRRVFAPKAGAWQTFASRYTRGSYSDVVFFSSISALIGTAGQSNYGSANLFVEAAAAALRQAGCPVHSVSWGAWSGIGMAKSRSTVLSNSKRYGLGVIEPAVGLLYVQRVLAEPTDTVSIASPFDFSGGFWADNALLTEMPTQPLHRGQSVKRGKR